MEENVYASTGSISQNGIAYLGFLERTYLAVYPDAELLTESTQPADQPPS